MPNGQYHKNTLIVGRKADDEGWGKWKPRVSKCGSLCMVGGSEGFPESSGGKSVSGRASLKDLAENA